MQFGNLSGMINGTEQCVLDYELSGSAASFNTGTILNGDEDAIITVIVRGVEDASNYGVLMRMNSDSGSNYGLRTINGNGSSVTDRSLTGQSYINCSDSTNAARVCMSIWQIHIKSGFVRVGRGIFGSRISTSAIGFVDAGGCVWSDTATNLASITLIPSVGNLLTGTHITVLRTNNFSGGTPTGIITTPYIQGSWYRVGSTIVGSAVKTVTFSGLNGDNDVLYLLTWGSTGGGASGVHDLTINSDTSTNYYEQYVSANSTTVSAGNNTGLARIRCAVASATYYQGYHLIFAKSGWQRTVLSHYGTKFTNEQYNTICCSGWSNTANNITQLVLTDPNAGNQILTGSQFQLYALKPNG